MPAKKYRVTLSAAEREELTGLVTTGKVAALRRKHAQILLHADESEAGLGWDDAHIAQANSVHRVTVERVRRQCVEQGLEAALRRTPSRRYKSRKLDGAGEAKLVALVCGEPPGGRKSWSLELLAEELVRLGTVESISYETVRQTLKKTNLSLGGTRSGVSRPRRTLSL